MSVLLNIAMPKTCEVCPCNDDNWRCGATKEYFDYDDMCERRRADCPLIEVPTPHGRLVDIDKMIDRFWDGNSMEVFKSELEQIQTVIEAED